MPIITDTDKYGNKLENNYNYRSRKKLMISIVLFMIIISYSAMYEVNKKLGTLTKINRY